MKKLNIGMVGYGFMGRAHSNAFLQAPRYFDLSYEPVLKAVCARDAGYWLRDESGALTKSMRHICWDGCMFSNDTMMKPETWKNILRTMIAVRDAHGWSEA